MGLPAFRPPRRPLAGASQLTSADVRGRLQNGGVRSADPPGEPQVAAPAGARTVSACCLRALRRRGGAGLGRVNPGLAPGWGGPRGGARERGRCHLRGGPQARGPGGRSRARPRDARSAPLYPGRGVGNTQASLASAGSRGRRSASVFGSRVRPGDEKGSRRCRPVFGTNTCECPFSVTVEQAKTRRFCLATVSSQNSVTLLLFSFHLFIYLVHFLPREDEIRCPWW